MKVLVVEDEALAAERLMDQIIAYDNQIQIEGPLDTVSETVQFLRRRHGDIDLIFLDIQLADGKSFEIFQEINFHNPVIFTTAYDEYAIDAFRLNSIDYLLKPIVAEELKSALDKYFKLSGLEFSGLSKEVITGLLKRKTHKERFLVKAGKRMYFRHTQDIDHFTAQDKLCYLVDLGEGRKFLIDHTLEQLEEMLNPERFFRISRSAIIQLEAIQEIRPVGGNRLAVRTLRSTDNSLLVSRSRVAE
ncbi:MAG: LytTR family DNA-binding domain-containing protein, partial [Cyclobacteriaceae bacterium]